MSKLAVEWERIKALGWPEFFARLPAYLELKKSVTRQTVVGWTLCSFYRSPSCWDVWIER